MAGSFPACALTGTRGDVAWDVDVLEGEIPAALAGSLYVVAAVGDAEHGTHGGGRAHRVPFLNGDGHVYRVHFAQGRATARRRPVRTPCLLADEAALARTDGDRDKWRFSNFGLARLSPRLGSRNFANTALQAVRFGDGGARLLVTYDAGRPVEIDPVTLAFRGHVGTNAQWRGQMLGFVPFRLLGSTAHPAWDGHTQELFVCENGRSLAGFVGGLGRLIRRWPPRREAWTADGAPVRDERLLHEDVARPAEELAADFLAADSQRDQLAAIRRWLETHEGLAAEDGRKESYLARTENHLSRNEAFASDLAATLIKHAFARAKRALSWREDLSSGDPGKGGLRPPYLRLLRWTGSNDSLQAWVVRRPDGSIDGAPIAIRSSSHQMITTRSFVVIFDTSFKFEMDLAMPHPDEPTWVTQALRRRLSGAQPLTARAYVIRKRDLVEGRAHVLAYPFKIHGEIVHLAADYEDDGRSIVIHAVDNRATDPAEFLLKGDLLGFDNRYRVPDHVLTMMPCGLDVNRVATYRLDVPATHRGIPMVGSGEYWGRARLVGSSEDPGVTWTMALGTAEGLFGCGPQPERLEASYWYCHGLNGELVNEIVYSLYDFEHDPENRPRAASMEKLHELADKGIAPSVVRVAHGRTGERSGRVTHLSAPEGCVFTSPQLLPGGWLAVIVFGRSALAHATDKELWILDAETLERRCRIDVSALDWPYTLHSTWIQDSDLPTTSNERDTPETIDDYAHVTDSGTKAFLERVFESAGGDG